MDDTPPTLLGLLRNRPGLLQSQSLSSIATPVISDSDYYGSGEWANAAMQTLKSLQSTVNATKVSFSYNILQFYSFLVGNRALEISIAETK